MKLTVIQTLIIILAIAVGTQISRWLPFLAFFRQEGNTGVYKNTSAACCRRRSWVCSLSIALKSTPIFTGSHGLPELIAALFVVLSYEWKENLLLFGRRRHRCVHAARSARFLKV